MNLSEAIVVKISHDLAGGIGATASTVELMGIDSTFISEAVPLLKQNTNILMSRLKFYRALFGAETKEISSSLVDDFLKTLNQKITFEGKILNRLQLSLVACGILLLGQGGTIKLVDNDMFLKGPEIMGRPEFKEILSNKKIQVTAENIEFHWFVKLINDQKLKLKTEFKASSAKLSLSA